MRRKRMVRIVLVTLTAILLLAAADVVTFYLFGKGSGPTRATQYLPQYTDILSHRRGFVCVGEKTWNSLSTGDKDMVDRLLHKYFGDVYHGESEIPEAAISYVNRREGERERLHGGCIINWRVVESRPLWLRLEYSVWESQQSAWGCATDFVWVFSRWVRLRTAYQWVV